MFLACVHVHLCANRKSCAFACRTATSIVEPSGDLGTTAVATLSGATSNHLNRSRRSSKRPTPHHRDLNAERHGPHADFNPEIFTQAI